MERIQEQIVEPTEVLPQERVQLHAATQIMHVPVPQIQEQSPVIVNSQFPITAVEASQVVDSYSLSEEFAAPAEVTTLNTSSTSTSSCAPVRDVAHATPAPESDVPMHNNVGQELIPATLNPVGISTVQKLMIDEISGKLDTMIDALSPLDGLTDLALRMETVVAEVENASVMALRTNTSLLPDPKRRKIFPVPRIPEEGASDSRGREGRAIRCGQCTRWQFGRGLASPYLFLGAGYKSCMSGNRTRFLRTCTPRVILRSLSAYRREKPPILRLRARHVHGDPDGFVPVHLGTLDKRCDGL